MAAWQNNEHSLDVTAEGKSRSEDCVVEGLLILMEGCALFGVASGGLFCMC